jgi:AcrR family transcriptional regulator
MRDFHDGPANCAPVYALALRQPSVCLCFLVTGRPTTELKDKSRNNGQLALTTPIPTTAQRTRSVRADSRLPQILDAAAAKFAAKGFPATSIRDIVQDVGMLPGSLYCHFATKEELLIAVYSEGVRRISAAVTAAVSRHSDPWERLEAACVAHLEALLDRSNYAQVVANVGPESAPALAATMVELRDGYERMFAGLISELPLPPRTSRRTLRLMLLGALNWAPTWYRADGGKPPRRLAREFVRLLEVQLRATSGARVGK